MTTPLSNASQSGTAQAPNPKAQVLKIMPQHIHRAGDSRAIDATNPFNLRSGIEYAEDEHGFVIPPSPQWEYTPTAISLFQWDDTIKHMASTSYATSADCVVSPKELVLPNGLGLCQDGLIDLNRSVSNPNKRQRAPQSVQHYSLYPTERITVASFISKVNEFMRTNMVLCSMSGGAETKDILRRDWNPHHYCSTTDSILKGIELVLDTKSCDTVTIWKLCHLHDMLLENNWDRSELGTNLFWSRIVAILLAQCEIMGLPGTSLAIRMSQVRNYLEKKYDWDVQGDMSW